MAIRSIYRILLSVVCVFAAFIAEAQYSEDDLLKEANAFFEQGKYAEAMPLYSQLLSLNPSKPELNYKYGATALYGDADKKEEAIKFLRYASTKNGIDVKCWYFLGRAYHLNYQFADAIHAYNKYKVLAGSKESTALNIDREIEDCRNGQSLLSKIKEVKVLDKKQSTQDAFFRIYDLNDIGGKILVTPDELLSSLDKKLNHKSLIHFRGTGTTVYFSSYGKDGKSGLDIYRAEVLPGGSFSDPVKLGTSINSAYDEDYPFMHPDNATFYFSSKGHSSMGGYDVFKSTYAGGSFTNPENLDFAINTPDDDLFYIADSLKKMAYFASARSSKQGELHVYKVLVSSVPADITFVKGSFINRIALDNKLAKITVVDASTNKEVDVQYTDPQTGDYVLSFPRSGRYKLSIEAEKSDRIHAGTVEIPKSTGINAYLQEMELVSSAGVEKLLINNLFDQQYDGDVAELAQKLLRQRAALDVNFNAQEEVVPAPVLEEKEDNIALAYNAAGFGAGLSNEKVVEAAQKRKSDLSLKKKKITDLKQAARQHYFEAVAAANVQSAEAKDLISKATELPAEKRGEVMFKAGIAKLEAQNALREAENTSKLIFDLEVLEKQAEEAENEADNQAKTLESALNSNDYNTALGALKAEKSIQEKQDRTKRDFDALDQLQASSVEARNDAQKFLDRASSIRSQAEDAQTKLHNKKRQREKVSGKEAKVLDEEISRLTEEANDANNRASRAFEQAAKVQNQSFDKAQQFEILTEINNEVSVPNYQAPQSASISTANRQAFTTLETEVDKLAVDGGLVTSYLKSNPQATAQFESDEKAMAFKRAYADEEVDNDLAAYNSESENTEATEAFEVNIDDTPEEKADEQLADNESLAEGEIVMTGEIPADANERTSNDSKAIETDVSAAAVNQQNTETDESAEREFAEAENENAEAQLEIDAALAEAESNELEERGDDEAILAEAEATIGNRTKIDEPAALEVRETDQAPTDVAVENKIAAEHVKIEAAEDWIAIIDASIADLENGVGGDENDNIEEQLEQYLALKGTKEKEIAQSKAKISDLKGEATIIENDMYASDSQPENDQADALSRTEADLDSLSVSHVARLEMKMADAYTDKKYEKKIDQVDKDYLSEMASAELSGNSDPEIALERIKVNTKFIESLDQLIRGEAVSDLNAEDLIELRRIKGLEIRQDKLIETGEMVYNPRTPKAVEYAALMAEPVSDDKMNADIDQDDNELTGLSPEFAAQLRAPFSRNSLVTDYDNALQSIESTEHGEDLYAERIALNKSYLNSLQAEIQMYSAALEGESNAKNAELIQERYQILLAERSKVVDEINTDQKEIEVFASAEKPVAEEPLEVFMETEETDVSSDASERDIQPVAIKATPNYVKNVEQSFNVRLDAIETAELSDKERIEQAASLNAATALQIDSTLTELIAELDNPKAGMNKDSLQIQIQLLDAIAADKRQEADRLYNEADLLALAENTVPPVEVIETEGVNVDADKTTTEAELAEKIEINEIEAEWVNEPVIDDLKYKSLNANIALDQMDPMIDSLKLMKTEARNLVTDFNASADVNQKAGYQSELEDTKKRISHLQSRLTIEVAKSNAAEISYFQNSNNALISRLKEFETQGSTEKDIELHSSEIANLNRSYAEIESQAEKGEITEGERIVLENELIASLSTLNTSLEKKVKNVEPEVISVDMAADEIATHTNAERLLEVMMQNPDNYKPEPGKSYITPIHRLIETDLDEDQKRNLAAKDAALYMDYSFILKPTPESDRQLIESATSIDDRGFNLLESNPDQLKYLLASLSADSLKRMEMRQAAYAKKMDSESLEKIAEVNRLEGIIAHEENPNVKKELQNRVERIMAEATVNYQKSTMATFQAEKLRNLRKEQESEVVDAAGDLKRNELAEINQLMERESYTVVPSDFASAEMSKPKEENQKQIRKNKEREDVEPEVAEVAEVVPEPIATISGDTATAPDAGTSTAEATSDVMPVNENLSSIDEQLLLEAHGNWLNVFEIIADKDDFSDVKESLFVKSEGSVYSDRKPIPVDPVMPDGLVFQVQVGAYRNKIPQDLFGDFAPVMGQELENGITRYRAGIFRAYKQAISARNQIRERGYADAFVVAYVDGERLTGSQANQILEQTRVNEGMTVAETLPPKSESVTPPASTSTASQESAVAEDTQAPRTDYYNDPEAAEANLVEATTGLFYTVQVGVYSKPVKLAALYNLVELNSELTSNGTIRYTSGRYTSPETAGIRKAEVIEKGVSDAFITAYYNGKRISVAKAQRIFEEEGISVLSSAIGRKPTNQNADSSDSKSEAQKDDIKYVVILGSYAGAVPQNVANVFLERSDLKIRRVTAPNGISIYASPEFETREEAEDFLNLSLAAGVDSAVMGKVVNGVISAVDSR